MAASDSSPPLPDFITFLFSSKPKFDCYFLVGKRSLTKPRRIGAVKMMLMAHSPVLRTELEDSELAEKGDVLVEDIYPDTFRSLLKFIYGYDIIGDLGFDEADNMLYVAEKYMMLDLKKKLAMRLMSLLTPGNVCSLLNNPVCYTQLELNSAITQILRYETERVLDSPSFLNIGVEGFVTILVQDGLAVPEIVLWRAVMKWATHRVNSQEGRMLRQEISKVSKHLKICTLTGDQFCEEIAPAEILTSDEVNLVCQSIGRKRKLNELTGFCNEVKPRKRLLRSVSFWKHQYSNLACLEKQVELDLGVESTEMHQAAQYSFTILTKQYAIELQPLVCLAQSCVMEPEGWAYRMDSTIYIFNESCSDEFDDTPFTVTFSSDVEYGKPFEIPLTDHGKNVILLPDSQYRVEMSMRSNHRAFCNTHSVSYDAFENAHMVLSVNHQGQGFRVTSRSRPPPNCPSPPSYSAMSPPYNRVSPSFSVASPSFSPPSSCNAPRSPQYQQIVKWFPFKSLIYRIEV